MRHGPALCGLAALLLAAAPAHAQAQFRNFTAPGNLESPVQLDCIGLEAARPTYNPVDLYRAARVCIQAGRFDPAVRLFLLANVFGRYDMLRVADSTAHQAITVARMSIFGDLPKDAGDAFQTTAKAMIEDPQQQAQLCTRFRRIGPPTYHPRYMIQHGMGAFMGGQGNGLVKDFDPAAAWAKVLGDYMHCPAG